MPGECLYHPAQPSMKGKATAVSVSLHHKITAEKMCFIMEVLEEDRLSSSARHLIRLPLELDGPGSRLDICK